MKKKARDVINVLHIDDDNKNAKTQVESLLSAREDISLRYAQTLSQAKKQVAKQTPDVILLDMLMFEVSSTKLIRTIKAFTSAPIIIVTGLNDPDSINSAWKTGGISDYFVKNRIDPDRFYKSIKDVAKAPGKGE